MLFVRFFNCVEVYGILFLLIFWFIDVRMLFICIWVLLGILLLRIVGIVVLIWVVSKCVILLRGCFEMYSFSILCFRVSLCLFFYLLLGILMVNMGFVVLVLLLLLLKRLNCFSVLVFLVFSIEFIVLLCIRKRFLWVCFSELNVFVLISDLVIFLLYVEMLILFR